MLILTLVCVAWLEIIGIQSARKEARRREAVERLAGMMDAFMCDSVMDASNVFIKKGGKNGGTTYQTGCYRIKNGLLKFEKVIDSDEILPMYETALSSGGLGESPIGYRLRIMEKSSLDNASEFGDNWRTKNKKCGTFESYWLVGELYDYNGKRDPDRKPFFILPVCVGCNG